VDLGLTLASESKTRWAVSSGRSRKLALDEAEEQLRWYYSGQYEGEMGKHGVNPAADFSGEGEPGFTDRQRAAARRFIGIRERLSCCSDEQRHILRLAFEPAGPIGLESYGGHEKAVLHCAEVRAAHEASHTAHPLLEWLRRRAKAARDARGRDQERALRLVTRLREATELMVLEALVAYGAEHDRAQVREVVSVHHLAQRMDMGWEACANRLEERGVRMPRNSGAIRSMLCISVAELWVRWPEAATLLGRNSPVS